MPHFHQSTAKFLEVKTDKAKCEACVRKFGRGWGIGSRVLVVKEEPDAQMSGVVRGAQVDSNA